MQVRSLQAAICFLLIVTTTQAISADDRAYARALLTSIDIQHPKYFVRVYESEVKEKGCRPKEETWNIVSSKDIPGTSPGELTRVAYVRSAEVHMNNNIVIEFDREYIRRLGDEFEGRIKITAQLVGKEGSRPAQVPGYYEIGKDTTAVVAGLRSARELSSVVEELLFLYNVFDRPYKRREVLRDSLYLHHKTISETSKYGEVSTRFRQYRRLERNIPDLKIYLQFLLKPENFPLLNALAKNAEKRIDPRIVQDKARRILETDIDTLMAVLNVWKKDSTKLPTGYERDLFLSFHFRLWTLAHLFPFKDSTNTPEKMLVDSLWTIQYAQEIPNKEKRDTLLQEMNESLLAALADTHINLRAIGAEPGDEIRITITNLVNEEAASRPLIVSLKVQDLNGHMFIADSFLLLRRLNVDSEAVAQGIADVNFQPAPGTTFGYVWWKRNKFWRFLRPGFGVNVSVPKFDAENVDIVAGGTISLFGNMVHATIGSCLTCQKKRAYWGLGFSFTNIVSRLNGGGS